MTEETTIRLRLPRDHETKKPLVVANCMQLNGTTSTFLAVGNLVRRSFGLTVVVNKKKVMLKLYATQITKLQLGYTANSPNS